ncbi:MAG: HAMP domain-containing histidine kinase [Bacteroidales bacterium]|nr:HAMP domain-containing histidine kinase [Bacteroidales bacterium]
MEIRKKLLYQFIGIVAIILLMSSLSVYFAFSQGRKEEFYDRLGSKAKMVAQMLIEIDEIDAELLKRIEKNNPVSLPEERIIIYDYQDKIVYSTDEDNSINISPFMITSVRLKEEVRLKQGSYEILGQFYTGNFDRYVVFAAATDIYGLVRIERLKIILAIVFSISMVIVFLSGRIFVSRALQPISKIMSEVGELSVFNLNARISEGNGKDELAQLARKFNKMLERIESAFKTQKEFISNASHELRTPLTVITGHLEVILIKARKNEEYRKTIISVLGNIKNLNHISNRLLQLAQASSEYSEVEFNTIRIDEILWQARADLIKANADFNVNIRFSELIDDELKLQVSGNEQLLITAMVNLIDNGCKYSPDHTCDINVNNESTQVIISFADNGIGIPAEDIEMIFQPFYRGKNVSGQKGHGIGLSLVEKIILLHKGKINVSSELNKGSTFAVYLPLIDGSLLR